MISWQDLLHQTEALAETLSNLGTCLLPAVEALQSPGIPPSEMLLEQQIAARKAFMDVRADVLELAKSMNVLPISGSDTVTSVLALKSLLQTIAEAEEKRGAIEETRRRALEVLDSALRIVHRDTPDFPALLQCYARARELRSSIVEAPWTDMPSEAQALAEGTHPLSDLLTFVKRFEELDDTQWESLHTTIAQVFDQPLVTAARRGRLVLQAEVPSHELSAPLDSHNAHSIAGPLTEPSSLIVTELLIISPEQTRSAEQSETLLTEVEEVKANGSQTLQHFPIEPIPLVEEHGVPETVTSAVPYLVDNETATPTLPSSQQEQLLETTNISQPTLSESESLFPVQVEAQKKNWKVNGLRSPLLD